MGVYLHGCRDLVLAAVPSRSASVAVSLALLALGACSNELSDPTAPSGPVAAVASSGTSEQGSDHRPGRVLVSFAPGADRAAVARAHGATLGREFIPGVWTAGVPEGREIEVAEALRLNPNVSFAEPDYVRIFGDPLCPSCTPPSDQLFEWQWNMHNDGDVDLGLGLVLPTAAVDADIDWLEAYDFLGPAPDGAAKIGVLDTGIRATHIDFCGKAVTWKDFYDNPSPTPYDPYGHGTHVSGIAGACVGGGTGVAGIAYGPNMEFVVGKVCAVDGTCLSSAIAEGIYWAVDQGANVINMSFGDVAQSSSEAQALAYAAQNNVLPVCAAGNDGVRSVLFPAADPNCVAVSATDFGDERASYSSFGPEVELSAPGGDVEDALLGTSMIVSTWSSFDDDYLHSIGTSMAAPHVTGLAALLYSLGVTNAADVRACLRNTSDDLGPSGWDEEFGWGRINMHTAVVGAGDCATGGGGGGGDNVAPTAVLTHTCNGLDCSFDGTDSWDSDGSLVSHTWDFGDGSTATGPLVGHSYTGPGTYQVRLTVVDDDGATGTSVRDLSVGIIHVSDLEAWSERSKGNRWEAFLSVSVVDVSGTPVDGATVAVAWSGIVSGSGSATTAADGIATIGTGNIRRDGLVTFTVTSVSHPSLGYDPALDTDADGDSDGSTITVGPPNDPPQAAFNDDCVALVCTFTDASSDSDGTIVSWAWDFGDGGTSSERNPPPHTYALSLFYLVTLTVTDDQGATATESRLVFAPPVDVGLVLTGAVSKVKGSKQVDLQWEGGSGDVVDLYRDGVVIEREYAPRSYTDSLGRSSGSHTYKVCETFTNACSNELTVQY
jgi:serine protease